MENAPKIQFTTAKLSPVSQDAVLMNFGKLTTANVLQATSKSEAHASNVQETKFMIQILKAVELSVWEVKFGLVDNASA